jgi:hypothetical protein
MFQSRRLSNRLNSLLRKEQRVFKPAQHADGRGEVSVGRSSRRIAWWRPIEELSRSREFTRINLPAGFYRKLDSANAENRIVEVERKPAPMSNGIRLLLVGSIQVQQNKRKYADATYIRRPT